MADEMVQMQNAQRQLQAVIFQKQRMEMDLAQIEMAQAELKNASGKIYRSLGTLLLQEDKADVSAFLADAQKTAAERRGLLTKQEEKLRAKIDEIQKKLETKGGGAA